MLYLKTKPTCIAFGIVMILIMPHRTQAADCNFYNTPEKCESLADQESKQIQTKIDKFFDQSSRLKSLKKPFLAFVDADVNWVAYHDTISGGAFTAIEHLQVEIDVKNRSFEELKETLSNQSPSSEAAAKYRDEDIKLNANYKFCIKSGEDNSGNKPELAIAAEKAWILYRDAFLKTVDSKLKKDAVAQLTRFRNLELKPCRNYS